ncbi:hypothetical protein [Moraxella lacunata]|uniref:hypothetical protein n=1 Tax=Moraxella lacunata TaxID=477 RepID=UPI003EE0EBA6
MTVSWHSFAEIVSVAKVISNQGRGCHESMDFTPLCHPLGTVCHDGSGGGLVAIANHLCLSVRA